MEEFKMALKEFTKKDAANSYELVVTVDGETFEKAINKVYKKQVKSINIPGSFCVQMGRDKLIYFRISIL